MKKRYETPESVVTQIRLESPICSGSVEITNPDNQYGKINDQQVNSTFNPSFDNGTWEEVTSSTTTNP